MAQKESVALIIAGSLFFSLLAGSSFSKVRKEDIKKFPPITGEIYGQAVPGVQSISVNGRPVPFDENLNFRTLVKLKAGEKYLTLKFNYAGLSIIKKYLVLRRPKVKTFKIYVPKEKVEKTVRAARPSWKEMIRKKQKRQQALVKKQEKLRALAEKRRIKKIAKKIKPKAVPPRIYGYLYVWEFSEGKILLVKENQGEYSAEIHIPVSREWLNLRELTSKELKELIWNMKR